MMRYWEFASNGNRPCSDFGDCGGAQGTRIQNFILDKDAKWSKTFKVATENLNRGSLEVDFSAQIAIPSSFLERLGTKLLSDA